MLKSCLGAMAVDEATAGHQQFGEILKPISKFETKTMCQLAKLRVLGLSYPKLQERGADFILPASHVKFVTEVICGDFGDAGDSVDRCDR